MKLKDRSPTRLRVIAAVLLVAAVGIAAHDLLRDPCSRISSAAWSWFLWRTGLGPASLPHVSFEQPLRGFRDANPWSLGGQTSATGWKNVQSAERTAVGDLQLVLVSPPSWKSESEPYFEELARSNPSASPLADSSGVPPLLLLQQGGGVERLSRQFLLTRGGTLQVWELGLFSQLDRLGVPRRLVIPRPTVDRLFQLANRAEFPAGRIRFEGVCGMLDGGVTALTYFDGDRLGRVQFNNNRSPAGALAEIAAEIERLATPAPSSGDEGSGQGAITRDDPEPP